MPSIIPQSPPALSATNTVVLSAQERRDRRASMGDGALWGVMVGIGETYLAPFALAMGHGEVFSGMVTTIPQVCGGLLQLVCPWGVKLLRSHARWVVLMVALQTLCFIPLFVGAVVGSMPAWCILGASAIYWTAGLGGNPAWSVWIGTLIPGRERAKFFAQRSRLSQAATLIGFLGGGILLQVWGGQTRSEQLTYAAIFAIAAISRGLSLICLTRKSEPVPLPANMRTLPVATQWRRLTSGPTGRLFLFALAMQTAVYVSGPYFVPYMRKALHHEYWQYASILGVSYLAKYLSLPFWGRVAHRHGARTLLWLATVGVVPLAIAWCLNQSYGWLVVIQVGAGTMWGAYELALFLMQFETIPEEERTSLLTAYNLANTGAAVFGSALGGGILLSMDVTPTAYLWVFATSTLLRFASLGLLARVRPSSLPPRDTHSPHDDDASNPDIVTLPVAKVAENVTSGSHPIARAS